MKVSSVATDGPTRLSHYHHVSGMKNPVVRVVFLEQLDLQAWSRVNEERLDALWKEIGPTPNLLW